MSNNPPSSASFPAMQFHPGYAPTSGYELFSMFGAPDPNSSRDSSMSSNTVIMTTLPTPPSHILLLYEPTDTKKRSVAGGSKLDPTPTVHLFSRTYKPTHTHLSCFYCGVCAFTYVCVYSVYLYGSPHPVFFCSFA